MTTPGGATPTGQLAQDQATDSDATPQASIKEKEKDIKKDSKRRFFGLGKRKDVSSEKTPTKQAPTSNATPTISTTSATAPQIPAQTIASAPLDIGRPTPSSPPRAQQGQLSAAASPARSSRMRSSSPRLHSPASSLIFERNVQESVPDNLSVSGIPSHIQTEDHIPPVLEASSLAITDDHLNPDEVEIVMHSAHQPAAEKVISAGGQHTPSVGASDTAMSMSPLTGMSPVEDLPQSLHSQFLAQLEQASGAHPPTGSNPLSPVSSMDGGADSYAHGSADPADVRRLSFISFADVVQSEHRDADLQSSRDSMLLLQQASSVPALSLSGGSTANRSPSPVRSPASSHGVGTSPPTSGTPSIQGLDIGSATSATANKGARGSVVGIGSPTSPGGGARSETGGGDIVVETMRQALKRTNSREFGGLTHKTSEDVASPVSPPAGVGEVR